MPQACSKLAFRGRAGKTCYFRLGSVTRTNSQDRRFALNRVCSIFSQLLQFFPRLEFEQAVRETRANDMLAVHLLGPIHRDAVLSVGAARSLREICAAGGCEGN